MPPTSRPNWAASRRIRAGAADIYTERECLDAIAFALEGDPSEYDSDTQAIALEVSVAPAV